MKWYQRTGWILVFLIFFFPVGCYLMWKYRPGWNKWVKWPLTAVFGLWFLAIAATSLTPASSPDSLTLSEAPETPLAPGESVTLKLQTAPAKFPLRGLSYIYDPAMIEVEKGAQDDEIVVTAKETPGTAAVCAQTSDGEAVSNIILIDIEDPATAETAQADLDAKIQAAVDEALAESQALLAEKESELSEISGLLEETQDELEQTKAELVQTQDELEETKAELEQAQNGLEQTQDELETAEAANSRSSGSFSGSQASDSITDNASSQSADTGITNSQTVLITRTGSKYHTHKCGNGTYYEATLDEALARGLTPCEKCY